MFCCTAARPQQWACLPLVLAAPIPTRAGTNLGVQNDRIGILHLINWLAGRFVGWLVDWLIGWLIVWLVNCLMEGYSPSKNWYQDRTASRFFFVFSGSFPVSWGCWCPHANQRRCLPSVLSASDPSGFCQSCVTSYDPTWQYEQPPCSIGQNHMKNNEQPPFSIGQNMPKPSIYFFFPGHVW